MLDIKFIRENTAKCKERLALRGTNYDEAIDQALALDDKRKAIIGEVESLKAQQNKVSKQIPQMKKAGEDTTAIMAEMKEISAKVKELDAGRTEVEAQLRETLLGIPNVPADRVPAGADDTCNPEIAAGVSRRFLTMSRRHIGISVQTRAFCCLRLQARSRVPVSIFTAAWARVWSVR